MQIMRLIQTAADGLWDTLTQENAVETLQLWLQDGRLKSPGGAHQGGSAQQPESAESVPVFSGAEELECRVGYPWDWKGRAEDFVVEERQRRHPPREECPGRQEEGAVLHCSGGSGAAKRRRARLHHSPGPVLRGQLRLAEAWPR